MKAARVIVMAGALLAAGGAGFIALSLANREPETQIVEVDAPEVPVAHVLVAAGDISIGSTLRDDAMRWQEWPEDAVSPGFITRNEQPEALESYQGSIARALFYEGEPIRDSKLVRSERGYMSAILPSGKRAIATQISTETSAGGFILPNDRVDIIMTRRADDDDGETFQTDTILENIRVLAIDQAIEEQDGEAVVVGETATLELTPRQAEIMTVAQQMADRLTLSLRSLEDSKSDETKSAEHLLGGERGAGMVRIIKYGNAKDVSVGQGQ